MSHSVVLNGANFTKYVDRTVPYLAAAKGYYLFGTDAAASTPNLAPGASVNLSVLGAPTYGEGFAEFPAGSTANHFRTGLSVSGGQTFVAVVTKATYDFIMGTDFHALGNANPSLLRANGGYGGSSFKALLLPGSAFAFIASTVDGDKPNMPFTIYTGAAGVLNGENTGIALNHPTLALPNISPVLIGPFGTFGGTVGGHKIAASMVFDTYMTQAQIAELYDYFRFKLPARGISVY